MKLVLPAITFLFSLAAFSQKRPSLNQLLQGRLSCLVARDKPSPELPAAASNHYSLPMDTVQRTTIRIRCYATVAPGNEPLIILDGIPLEEGKLSTVNPNNIESISILKSASAPALYGCRASNGVILITSKKTAGCGLLVLDEQNGLPISQATVVLNSRRGKVVVASNKDGRVWLPEQAKGTNHWTIISSAGYTSFVDGIHFDSANQVHTVFLKKGRNYLDTVLVTTRQSKRIRCRLCGGTFTGQRPHSLCNKSETPSAFSVWPNPVRAGQMLTVSPPVDFTGDYQVLSSAGQILQQGKSSQVEEGSFQLVTGNWPAGVYFIRCLTAEASGKTVIQKIIVQ